MSSHHHNAPPSPSSPRRRRSGERQPAGAGNGGLLGRQWTRFAAAHTADEDKLRAELALVMAPKPSGRLSEMMVYI